MPSRGKSRHWRDLLWRKSRRSRSDKTKKHREDVPGNASERQVEKKQAFAQLRRGAIIVAVCYGCIALWQAIAVGRSSRTANSDLQIRHLRSAQESLLPDSWNDWQRIGFESIARQEGDPNGQISQQWRYQRDDQTIVVSIDGPFVGWHSLGNCLVGQGWEIQERVTSNYRDHGDDLAGGCAELQTKKGLNRYAFVVYATFDAANRPLMPPDTYVQFRAVRRFPQLSQLLKRIAGHDDESIGRDDVMAYQLQVFAEHAVPLSDGQREQIRELFHDFRRIVTGP